MDASEALSKMYALEAKDLTVTAVFWGFDRYSYCSVLIEVDFIDLFKLCAEQICLFWSFLPSLALF